MYPEIGGCQKIGKKHATKMGDQRPLIKNLTMLPLLQCHVTLRIAYQLHSEVGDTPRVAALTKLAYQYSNHIKIIMLTTFVYYPGCN